MLRVILLCLTHLRLLAILTQKHEIGEEACWQPGQQTNEGLQAWRLANRLNMPCWGCSGMGHVMATSCIAPLPPIKNWVQSAAWNRASFTPFSRNWSIWATLRARWSHKRGAPLAGCWA